MLDKVPFCQSVSDLWKVDCVMILWLILSKTFVCQSMWIMWCGILLISYWWNSCFQCFFDRAYHWLIAVICTERLIKLWVIFLLLIALLFEASKFFTLEESGLLSLCWCRQTILISRFRKHCLASSDIDTEAPVPQQIFELEAAAQPAPVHSALPVSAGSTCKLCCLHH